MHALFLASFIAIGVGEGSVNISVFRAPYKVKEGALYFKIVENPVQPPAEMVHLPFLEKNILIFKWAGVVINYKHKEWTIICIT